MLGAICGSALVAPAGTVYVHPITRTEDRSEHAWLDAEGGEGAFGSRSDPGRRSLDKVHRVLARPGVGEHVAAVAVGHRAGGLHRRRVRPVRPQRAHPRAGGVALPPHDRGHPGQRGRGRRSGAASRSRSPSRPRRSRRPTRSSACPPTPGSERQPEPAQPARLGPRVARGPARLRNSPSRRSSPPRRTAWPTPPPRPWRRRPVVPTTPCSSTATPAWARPTSSTPSATTSPRTTPAARSSTSPPRRS